MSYKYKLSVIMITGTCRERAQYALSSLDKQENIKPYEIIVVDLGGEQFAPFTVPEHMNYLYIPLAESTTWGQARQAALEKTNGEIIAFIEDHCFAEPNWAEKLIETFESGSWAAVGYAIKNANPQTWVSRAGLVSDYILWMDPVSEGEAKLLPGNNVAYCADLLLPLKDRLPIDLSVDFNIHEYLHHNGYKLAMSSKALARHQNYDKMSGLLNANFYYCRMLAANRVQSQNWGFFKRAVYIFGAPLGAPVIKFIRIVASLKTRRTLLPQLLTALPLILLTFSVSGIGEMLGYLLGAGNAAQDFNTWELYNQRTAEL